jgi:hypothetical protein
MKKSCFLKFSTLPALDKGQLGDRFDFHQNYYFIIFLHAQGDIILCFMSRWVVSCMYKKNLMMCVLDFLSFEQIRKSVKLGLSMGSRVSN